LAVELIKRDKAYVCHCTRECASVSYFILLNATFLRGGDQSESRRESRCTESLRP
jgi:glutamyl/glutaminyl-tRNA synthetase